MDNVVLVTDRPRSREAKHAMAIRHMGWKTVLIYIKCPNYELNLYFDVTIKCNNGMEALKAAEKFNGQIFHVYSMMSSEEIEFLFIKHKPGTIIYDVYDMARACHTEDFILTQPEFSRRALREKYLIENSDALCVRDFQIQYVNTFAPIKLPSKILNYPLYCSAKASYNAVKLSDNDKQFHAVVMGHIGIERLGDVDDGYIEIATMLAEQNINLHIYMHWFHEHCNNEEIAKIYRDYITLSERTGKVHIHKTVPMNTVIKELAQYDIGMSVNRLTLFNKQGYSKNNNGNVYGEAGRTYDYVDAGIIPVAHKGTLTYNRWNNYEIVLDGSIDFFKNAKEILLNIPMKCMKDKINYAQSEMSVIKNSYKLIEFYKDLNNVSD
jgi:hypothetical protein